jgi:hypothetical protein
MYALIGFVAVLSLVWGVLASNYFFAAVDLSGVARILPSDISYILFSVALPIILMLMIVLIAISVASNHMTRSALSVLLKTNRAGLEGMEEMSKSLIILQKLGFTSQFFATMPLIVNDICLSIADIVTKSGLASDIVVFDALNRQGDARLYAVCNIILEIRASTPHFDENLRRKVKKDSETAAAIAIFSSKYNQLLKTVKAYDAGDLVYGVLDRGLLGQVHGILISALGDKKFHAKSNNSVGAGESRPDSGASGGSFFESDPGVAPAKGVETE